MARWLRQTAVTWPALLALLALIAGCTAPQLAQRTELALPPVPPERQMTPTPPLPIPYRQIELAGYCSRTEDDGFREEARVRVADNVVQALNWKLWVSRRGSCAFDLDEFRQVMKLPHIELLARDASGCKLMVWQDPRRITLAHAGCQQRCTPGIYEEAWPVMFDPDNGMCAQTR
ncbi:hypothetical protein K6V06_01340 [Cupriavidus sp. AU9028]|nr:hypothetical protein [Cupriavidus sp. AU9028]